MRAKNIVLEDIHFLAKICIEAMIVVIVVLADKKIVVKECRLNARH